MFRGTEVDNDNVRDQMMCYLADKITIGTSVCRLFFIIISFSDISLNLCMSSLSLLLVCHTRIQYGKSEAETE